MTIRELPQGMEASIGCAARDGMGGGIFAKTAKTPPLQSGVCGDGIAIRIAPKGRPLPPPCAYHTTPHAALLWRPYGLYNDAARRVATNALPRMPPTYGTLIKDGTRTGLWGGFPFGMRRFKTYSPVLRRT